MQKRVEHRAMVIAGYFGGPLRYCSIVWRGALPFNDPLNDVGRLTLNVLNRFSISQNRGDSQTA